MADAVHVEPLSVPVSLITGKLTGKFAKSGALPALKVRLVPIIRSFPVEFPMQRNREFRYRYQGNLFRITGIGRRRNWSTPLSPANQHSRRDDDLNAGRRPLANQSHAERPRELSTWQHVEKTPREYSGAEDIVNVALRVSCSRLRTCRKLLQRLRGDPLN